MKKMYIMVRREKKAGRKKFQTKYVLFDTDKNVGNDFKTLKSLVESINFKLLNRLCFNCLDYLNFANFDEIIIHNGSRTGKLEYSLSENLSGDEKMELLALLPEIAL